MGKQNVNFLQLMKCILNIFSIYGGGGGGGG